MKSGVKMLYAYVHKPNDLRFSFSKSIYLRKQVIYRMFWNKKPQSKLKNSN